MFFSLAQTLVCVLLINGGLYALHLSGGGTSNGEKNGPVNSKQLNMMLPSSQHAGGIGSIGGLKKPGSLDTANGRLTEELADLAQLERERLMLLGLAKQTAAANAATGHHGRPIITGRIQMTPVEEEVETEYPALLMKQARPFMFGNVRKQPSPADDYDAVEEYDSAGLSARRHPVNYEYGHIVQPADHEYDAQPIDLDSFMELESEPDVDDMIPDLDGYQYLDELLADQHKGWEDQQQAAASFGGYHGGHHAGRFQNPYQTLEELEANAPLALQELFNKQQHEAALKQQQQRQHQHQHQQQQQQQQQQRSLTAAKARNGFNMRLEQKWQRKRAQEQSPILQRNIFGHHKPQLHHFGSQHNSKLAMANSEATATQHIGKTSGSEGVGASAAAAAAETLQSSSSANQNVQPQNQPQNDAQQLPTNADNMSGAGSTTTSTNGGKLNAAPQQEAASLLHPNHKRSGGMSPAAAAAAAAAYAGLQPPVTHSIASQLMLRTARGQRQYDVPQIECPTAMDGMERFACPTPDLQGRYRCIDDHVLCDGFIDCPEGEDEDRRSCMFYKTTKAHLDVLADALLRWARGR